VKGKAIVAGVLCSFLLSCGQDHQKATSPLASNSSTVDNTRIGKSGNTPSPSESLQPIKAPTESSVTVAEAAQLAPNQIQELMAIATQKQLDRSFRIVIPTYIPPGFQAGDIETSIDKSGRYGPPNIISDYKLVYRNPSSGACFSIEGSSGGWGAGEVEHQDTPVFSEALGIVVLSTLKFDNESHSSIIQWRDAPIVRSGRGYGFGSGQGQNCGAMNFQEAVKVVESLQYMDSPQTKAKSLDEIERDARRLVNKFGFPLSSCGDPPSGNTDHWYPVFIDGASADYGGQEYCKDALVKEVKGGFGKVQLGSFTSYERASEFAKAVGGRVGEPDK